MQRNGKSDQRRFLLPRILPARRVREAASTEREDEERPSDLLSALGDIIARVPEPRATGVTDPSAAAQRVARTAAHRAALLSGSLALPPGPMGMITILPDLYLIWKLQRQMVSDIFALHGRSAELTRSSMIYCLFRHLASHVARDVAVRAAERAMITAVTTTAVQGTGTALGMHLARRIAGASAGRWIPLAGAAAVGAYAYWDTLQVAKASRRVLSGEMTPLVIVDIEPKPA